MALNPLAMDMMLPALPTIASAFHIDVANRPQAVLSTFLIGFGVGQFVMGPLSDRFGRRPVLLGGMAAYCVASLLAIAAQSFETLLLARALQGLGTSATRVIATSIVRDCYAGRRMASVMSLAMMVFITVPVVAPSFGQAVMLLTQWRGIFIVLMLYGVLALAWSALTPEDRTVQALLNMDVARSGGDTVAALQDFLSPMQNIVHAHADGHIGLFLPGRVPVRDAANDSLGLVPAQGWDARYDWKGMIPSNALARIDDPASGQIATANNKTVPEGYAPVLTREWEDPFRFWRIDQLLSATARHSVDSFKAIQLDTHDRYAQDLLPLLLKAGPWPDAQAQRAASLLAKWDTAMDADRPEPLIFSAWERALVRRLIADELGKDFPAYWSHHAVLVLNILRNSDGEARWCDDVTTIPREDCTSRIRLALDDALAELDGQYGGDMSQWRWGDAHHVIDEHQPFGQLPVLAGIFNREAPASGGAFTIRRGDFRFSSTRPYAAVHGSGYRAIYDLAHPDASLYMISTGESGNIYSPYYDDLIPYWTGGRYITIPTAPSAIAAAAKNRLTLQPDASAP